MNSGIYKILNLITDMYYIGSAINFTTRWRLHKNYLKLGTHKNRYLQAAWNKYGETAFEFSIIEITDDKNKLIEQEQFWINLTRCCDRSIGYNLNPIAGSWFGRTHDLATINKMKNRKFSVEHLKKLTIAANNRSPDHYIKLAKALKGKTASSETKLKMSKTRKGKQLGNKHGRNLLKWPHELGSKCECNECKQKKSERNKIYSKKSRQNMIGSWL